LGEIDRLEQLVLLDERQDPGGHGEVVGVVAGRQYAVVGVGIVDGGEGELLEVVQLLVLQGLGAGADERGQQQREQQQQQGQQDQQRQQREGTWRWGTHGESSSFG